MEDFISIKQQHGSPSLNSQENKRQDNLFLAKNKIEK